MLRKKREEPKPTHCLLAWNGFCVKERFMARKGEQAQTALVIDIGIIFVDSIT